MNDHTTDDLAVTETSYTKLIDLLDTVDDASNQLRSLVIAIASQDVEREDEICQSSEPTVPMEIDKHVPITRKKRYRFEDMAVGDSVFFADFDDAGRMTSAAYSYAKHHKNGFRVTRRKEGTGYRVWRVA